MCKEGVFFALFISEQIDSHWAVKLLLIEPTEIFSFISFFLFFFPINWTNFSIYVKNDKFSTPQIKLYII